MFNWIRLCYNNSRDRILLYCKIKVHSDNDELPSEKKLKCIIYMAFYLDKALNLLILIMFFFKDYDIFFPQVFLKNVVWIS